MGRIMMNQTVNEAGLKHSGSNVSFEVSFFVAVDKCCAEQAITLH